MTRVTQSGTGVADKRADLAYNALGQQASITRYSDLAGTQLVASSSYSYDLADRLVRLTHSNGGVTYADYAYTFDAANRMTRFVTPDGSSDYVFDDTNQLTAADHSYQTDEGYSYSGNGNRTNTGYVTGAGNRLLSDGTYNYAYDAEGNLVRETHIASGAVREFTWDYRNRLVSVINKDAAGNIVQQKDYVYDVDQRIIAETLDPDGAGAAVAVVERFVYDGNNKALVFNAAGSLTNRYLFGPNYDQVLADEQPASAFVYWSLADHIGTVRDLITSSGILVKHLQYDSFGQITNDSMPSIPFRYGFTGQDYDGDVGMTFYGADGTIRPDLRGRFISQDPAGFSAGPNLYTYPGNNPTNTTDPRGLKGNDPMDPYVTNWHHLVPRTFKEFLKDKGVDVDSADYGWYLKGEDHRQLHEKGWNKDWEKWLDENKNKGWNDKRFKEELDKKMEQMKKDYRLVNAKGNVTRGMPVKDPNDGKGMPYSEWDKGEEARKAWREENKKKAWEPSAEEQERNVADYKKRQDAIKKSERRNQERNAKKEKAKAKKAEKQAAKEAAPKAKAPKAKAPKAKAPKGGRLKGGAKTVLATGATMAIGYLLFGGSAEAQAAEPEQRDDDCSCDDACPCDDDCSSDLPAAEEDRPETVMETVQNLPVEMAKDYAKGKVAEGLLRGAQNVAARGLNAAGYTRAAAAIKPPVPPAAAGPKPGMLTSVRGAAVNTLAINSAVDFAMTSPDALRMLAGSAETKAEVAERYAKRGEEIAQQNILRRAAEGLSNPVGSIYATSAYTGQALGELQAAQERAKQLELKAATLPTYEEQSRRYAAKAKEEELRQLIQHREKGVQGMVEGLEKLKKERDELYFWQKGDLNRRIEDLEKRTQKEQGALEALKRGLEERS